ncbi:helix-turn-helix transcriptional regulator [Pseudaestuariivita atlantica]|uniref:helix-turn-helix transcriptional regulator n=1 Tax=Pseudaestuariivita atlantica TaxID=1317121 RepID=UPI00106C00EF|nr:helix-turn-helix transcriptional regulator [Pseudaestuariivita atlantica]
MTNAELSPADTQALTSAIEAVGQRTFPRALSLLCMGVSNAQAAHLSAFFRNDKPMEIYSTRTDPDVIEALGTYFDVAFVLDPFYELFLRDPCDRVDSLHAIAPDDFLMSEYYEKFFLELSLSDECGVMLPISSEAALFLSLGVYDDRAMSVARLRALLPVVGALARRHWTVLTPESPDGSGRLAAHLDESFAAFGNSVLSPREAEITRMILKGHSTKAIALMFKNSPETVKAHRRRIYGKLGLSAQGALLPLFLDALRAMPPGAKGDPLKYLFTQ